MKKLIYIFIGLITISGCEDVIDVTLAETAPRLVIDASLEFNESDNNLQLTSNQIKISLSASYFDNYIPPVNNATVFITNKKQNEVLNFNKNTSIDGTYNPPNDSDFNWNYTDLYELTVIYEGVTYTASTNIIPSAPIKSITLKNEDVLIIDDDNNIEVVVTIVDDPVKDNFYLFDFDFNLFLPFEDRFYQGKTFPFSYYYDIDNPNLQPNATIKSLGITQQYFNYMQLLSDQTNGGNGGPFESPPALLRGNIVNTNTLDDFALGYFNLSQTYSKDFSFLGTP